MISPLAKILKSILQQTGWRGALLGFFNGVFIAFGQAPFGVFWLALSAIGVALILGWTSISAKQAGQRGLSIGFGFGALTFIWIVEPFMVDAASDAWMAPFALFFMALGNGLFWALAFWVARKLADTRSTALILALPVAWTAVEVLRSYAFTGFPWGLTSYIWIDTPVYQLAAFTGPHGLTLLTLLLTAALVLFLAQGKTTAVMASITVAVAGWFGGTFLLNQPLVTGSSPRPLIRLIQPNAIQEQKWDPEFMPVFYNRQLTLTAKPPERPLDLIIWPEVAVPFLLNDEFAPFWEISGAADDVPVILGAQRLEGPRAYNSLAVLGPGGKIEQQYDKHHLVPFGEYLPGGALLERIGLKALAAQYGNGYSPGPGPRLLDMGKLGKVIPLICYEAIFPHEIRRVSERPDWMLMITNDAWFGKSAGPLQHLAQARARSVEMALPMVRVANTGVSAVIDARGRIVKSMPLGVSGSLDVDLPTPLPASLYWKFGDLPTLIALSVLGLLSFRRKPKSN